MVRIRAFCRLQGDARQRNPSSQGLQYFAVELVFFIARSSPLAPD